MSRLISRYRHRGDHRHGVTKRLPAWPPARDPWKRPSWDVPTLYLPLFGGAR